MKSHGHNWDLVTYKCTNMPAYSVRIQVKDGDCSRFGKHAFDSTQSRHFHQPLFQSHPQRHTLRKTGRSRVQWE